MLPLIDMANHSFEANARIAPGPGGSMLMLATKGLRAGEPVLISYGALPNDFLLLDYGAPFTAGLCILRSARAALRCSRYALG
jgi:hypothetical protein